MGEEKAVKILNDERRYLVLYWDLKEEDERQRLEKRNMKFREKGDKERQKRRRKGEKRKHGKQRKKRR